MRASGGPYGSGPASSPWLLSALSEQWERKWAENAAWTAGLSLRSAGGSYSSREDGPVLPAGFLEHILLYEAWERQRAEESL